MESSFPWPKPDTEGPLVIGIAGGSGSGKTTVAHALSESVPAASIIEHDAYYWARDDEPFEQRTKVNYDHPDAFETSLLVEHLKQLRQGQAIDKPIYDYAQHTRSGETRRVEPTPVIIIEGILVLAEAELRELMDLKVFVDTDADIRFIRRLERDINDRGRSVESVVAQYQETVRPMHLQFVEASKRYADLILPEGYSAPGVGTLTSMVRDYLSR
ncbi:MAG: uridine kinase [Acidimicrobiia bacterium]|nr:uridine kinase [Acidimicrobiia bacterium]MDH3470483.1 uridine kinase [Acidimicrobiia bacterium]